MSILKSKSRLRYPHAGRESFPTRDSAVVSLCFHHWIGFGLEGNIINRLEASGHSLRVRMALLYERPAGHARHHPAEARRRLSVSLVPVTSATACYIVLYRLVRNLISFVYRPIIARRATVMCARVVARPAAR